MERFSKVTLNRRGLNPDVAMHHMVIALRLGPFLENLCKKLVMDLYELWQRATNFMQLEKLREF